MLLISKETIFRLASKNQEFDKALKKFMQEKISDVGDIQIDYLSRYEMPIVHYEQRLKINFKKY